MEDQGGRPIHAHRHSHVQQYAQNGIHPSEERVLTIGKFALGLETRRKGIA